MCDCMDVLKLNDLKSAIIFDMPAISAGPDFPKKLVRYGLALNNFAINSKVNVSFLRMPPTSEWEQTNLKFEITRDSVPDLMQTIAKKTKPELLVAFGKLDELLPSLSESKIKNALLITDEKLDGNKLSTLPKQVKVLPGRVLFTFYQAFWWRVTPFESIEESDIQSSILPDKSINELSLASQLANKYYGENKRDECQETLDLCLSLYPKHLPTRLVAAGLMMADYEKNLIPEDQRVAFVDSIMDVLTDIDSVLKSLGPANKNNQKDIAEIVVKFNMLNVMFAKRLSPSQAERVKQFGTK